MTAETVRVQIVNTTNSGKRHGWWKQVKSVDPAGKNGYAIEGEFLKEGYHDLPIGAVLVEQWPTGSVKNWGKSGMVYTVTPDGIREWSGTSYDWTKKFVFLRDELIDALAGKPSPLSQVVDVAALREERAKLHARLAEVNALLEPYDDREDFMAEHEMEPEHPMGDEQ